MVYGGPVQRFESSLYINALYDYTSIFIEHYYYQYQLPDEGGKGVF